MATWLKQSTAVTIEVGPFVDSTDGVTAETALTISQADVRLSKNGAAFAQKNDATAATHMENGYYSCPLNATDTNTLGRLRLAVSEAGALPVWMEFLVVPANVWDSFLGADKLQVDAVEISGDSAAADNLEAAADGSGYNLGGGSVVAASVTGAVGSVTGNVGGNVVGSVDSVVDPVTVGTNNDKTGYSLSAAGVQAIWDALTTALTTASSIGKLLVDNLNATISSRSSHTAADVWTSGTRTITGTAAGALTTTSFAAGAIDAAALASDAGNEIADALLNRNVAGGSSAGRLVKDALRRLRNRVAISGGTLTVYQEDDSTSAWSATVTTTAGDPVSQIDPA